MHRGKIDFGLKEERGKREGGQRKVRYGSRNNRGEGGGKAGVVGLYSICS